LLEIAGLQAIGHGGQNVADLAGEFLHQPVLVGILFAEDLVAVKGDQIGEPLACFQYTAYCVRSNGENIPASAGV
jgi:hypothetical protein